MSFEVRLTQQAQSDLRLLFDYIALDLESPHNAAGQIDRLEEGILSLSRLPDRFRVYDREPWRSRGLRVMPVDNYLVFYLVSHEARVTTIVRIVYRGRDIDQHLG